MSLHTFTFLELQQALQEACNDFIEVDTTTNLTTNNSIVSTTLKQYDDGANGHFDGWWAYITEGNNLGVERKTGLPGTTTYATATGTLTILGAALSAETAAMTIRLTRYEPRLYRNAIIEAIKELYPTVHKPVDDISLISGNILPDGSFESWSSTSALNFYTASNITLARTNTVGYIRGQKGSYSMKCTASADSGYVYISSDSYPQLLDLMGRSVSFYSWALPEVADDAFIEIYTLQADGTAQTLTSTTTCPAGYWTKLELVDQTLNDDLVKVEIRWKVKTNSKYSYFDDAYVNGMDLDEYYLPDVFIDGEVSQVWLQDSGYSDESFYDLQPFMNENNGSLIRHHIISDGTYQYLKLDEYPFSGYRMRLLGSTPLEIPTTTTSTVTLDDRRSPLLVAKARMLFWERSALPLTVDATSKADREYSKAERDYYRLVTQLNMGRKARKL
jgi:hypothetical protein